MIQSKCLLTTLSTIGRNIVEIAVLLVNSVMEAVIAPRHMTMPQVGQLAKKLKLFPIISDKPET